MASDLQARVAKAFRVRGPAVRSVYFTMRRAGRFLRDAERRSVLASLPPAEFQIPHDAGFLLLPPATFGETPEVVRDAREALAKFDAAVPPGGKNRKRFLQNVIDAETLTLDSPIVRLAPPRGGAPRGGARPRGGFLP